MTPSPSSAWARRSAGTSFCHLQAALEPVAGRRGRSRGPSRSAKGPSRAGGVRVLRPALELRAKRRGDCRAPSPSRWTDATPPLPAEKKMRLERERELEVVARHGRSRTCSASRASLELSRPAYSRIVSRSANRPLPERGTRLLATRDSSPQRSAPRYGLGGLEREAAREDAQAAEQRLLVRVEKVVAPGDRRVQRLLSRRQVGCAVLEERQAPVQPLEERVRRAGARTRAAASSIASGSQSSRVQMAATVASRATSAPAWLRALDEELDGLAPLASEGTVVDALAGDLQLSPARDDDAGSSRTRWRAVRRRRDRAASTCSKLSSRSSKRREERNDCEASDPAAHPAPRRSRARVPRPAATSSWLSGAAARETQKTPAGLRSTSSATVCSAEACLARCRRGHVSVTSLTPSSGDQPVERPRAPSRDPRSASSVRGRLVWLSDRRGGKSAAPNW